MLLVLKHSEQVLLAEVEAHPPLLPQRMAHTNIAELKRAVTAVSLEGKAASLCNSIFKLRCSHRRFFFRKFKAQSRKEKCKILSLSKRNQTVKSEHE